MRASTSPTNSMSLLTDLMIRTVDEGYAQAAARRRAAGLPASRLRATPPLLLGLLLVGLLVGAAAAGVRARDAAGDTARAPLVDQVRERTAANDRLESEVQALRSDIAATRQQALELSAAGTVAARRLATLEGVSGVGAVTGPGVVVTVDDAEGTADVTGADPRGQDDVNQGRVQDRDLQAVVNGLWEAGAEAVAVDGQRLTSMTAIRSAGEAVLVAYRPLAPPYVIEAIGDPADLEVGLLDSDGGLYLQVLADNYGIRYDVEQAERLRLPGASGITLRFAEGPHAGRPLEAGQGGRS